LKSRFFLRLEIKEPIEDFALASLKRSRQQHWLNRQMPVSAIWI